MSMFWRATDVTRDHAPSNWGITPIAVSAPTRQSEYCRATPRPLFPPRNSGSATSANWRPPNRSPDMRLRVALHLPLSLGDYHPPKYSGCTSKTTATSTIVHSQSNASDMTATSRPVISVPIPASFAMCRCASLICWWPGAITGLPKLFAHPPFWGGFQPRDVGRKRHREPFARCSAKLLS